MRLICRLKGCVYGEYGSCENCGEDIYAGNWIDPGGSWSGPIFTLSRKWKAARQYRHHKCEVCSKDMYFSADYCCSTECYDEWVPF